MYDIGIRNATKSVHVLAFLFALVGTPEICWGKSTCDWWFCECKAILVWSRICRNELPNCVDLQPFSSCPYHMSYHLPKAEVHPCQPCADNFFVKRKKLHVLEPETQFRLIANWMVDWEELTCKYLPEHGWMVNIQSKFWNPFTVPVWHFMPLDEELALLMVPFNRFFLRGTMRSHVIQYILDRFWILPSPEQYLLYFSFERWTLLECNREPYLCVLHVYRLGLYSTTDSKLTLKNCANFMFYYII